MYKVRLSRVLIAVIALTFLFIVPDFPQAKNIYKWTDEKGTIHFTDDPAKIPGRDKDEVDVIEGEENTNTEVKGDFKEVSPSPFETQNLEPQLEQRKREEEQALRELWRDRVLDIESKEQAIFEQIEITKQDIWYKKREVEYLLINGYFADHSIFELRYLEGLLNDLENQLVFVGQGKENLKREARREGIPPGYLRP